MQGHSNIDGKECVCFYSIGSLSQYLKSSLFMEHAKHNGEWPS